MIWQTNKNIYSHKSVLIANILLSAFFIFAFVNHFLNPGDNIQLTKILFLNILLVPAFFMFFSLIILRKDFRGKQKWKHVLSAMLVVVVSLYMIFTSSLGGIDTALWLAAYFVSLGIILYSDGNESFILYLMGSIFLAMFSYVAGALVVKFISFSAVDNHLDLYFSPSRDIEVKTMLAAVIFAVSNQLVAILKAIRLLRL